MIDVAWVALSLTDHVGSKTLRALMQHFSYDPKAILAADTAELRTVPGIGVKIAQSIREIDLSRVEQALERWERAGVRAITIHDPAYPPRLRQLEDAPPTLFVRGYGWLPLRKNVAIVGRRQPSEAARRMAQNLGSALVERGYVIVSGLASGIDTAAHMGAIAIPDGSTMAVLGSGVLNVYPPENGALAKTIMQHGALVSELHPAKGVSSSNLVARNRIITGLSDSLIVVETEADGGAMHAARFATAQRRTVFAIDFPASGNRALLEAGAAVIYPDLRDLPFE
jgi:DNA processing protein